MKRKISIHIVIPILTIFVWNSSWGKSPEQSFSQGMIHQNGYSNVVGFRNYSVAIFSSADTNSVLEVMRDVADWQINHPSVEHDKLSWHYGAFYPGLLALYDLTGEKKYIEYIKGVGEKNHWQFYENVFDADRIAVGQSYLDIYMQDGDKRIIENMKWVSDMYLERRAKSDVRYEGNPYYREWWTWCDALFMAPPFFAKMYKATGDKNYLNYMNKHWWLTSRYLYDSHDHLFYRDDRFFDKRTENGKKIFWSRGNGWVLAGLVRILQILPEDYTYRPQYITQFKEMTRKIVKLQGKDGLWGPSLLVPAQMGESSGSAFFGYALAWGVNNGLLEDAKYKKAALKAWDSLVKNVNADGRLGYVQAVGAAPDSVEKDETEVYGSGAFLLAGSEIFQMVKKDNISR